MHSVLPPRVTALVSILTIPILVACGGGGGAPAAGPAPTPTPTVTPSPSPTPSATSTPAPDFSQVSAAIDAYGDSDFAVLIGDETGTLYSRVRGNIGLDTQYAIASASKWFTAATIMRLVDRGVMSLDDNPQDHLTFWTSDPMDARSQVTLEQLLSFTSGFNGDDINRGCPYTALTTTQNCARSLYDDGLASAPGTTYSYGPDHMLIAAAMAEAATGKAYAQLFIDELASPLGLSAETRFTFPSQANPLASGGLSSNAQDTALFLTALLNETLVADRNVFLQDRTNSVTFGFRPGDTQGAGDWHYALGAWVECDKPVFDSECSAEEIYSSPGSFGWTPWVDVKNGYWGLIARRGVAGSAGVAITLEQQLQPLIVEALDP